MPEKRTVKRAKQDKRKGRAPSTQAGEFVHEEIEHIRKGKHGARSTKQAIAIGLSKARRAGVKLAAPKGRASAETRRRTIAVSWLPETCAVQISQSRPSGAGNRIGFCSERFESSDNFSAGDQLAPPAARREK